jgi:hypothetical protein
LSKNKVLGHFSYLHSVHILQKKIGENFFKTLNFIAVFVKVMILRNNGKILFLKFSKMLNFQISTNLDAKSKFFDSFCLHFNVCTFFFYYFFFIFGLNYQKLKNFAIKSENFGNFTKIGTFSKNNIKK